MVVIACISRKLKQFLANNPSTINMQVTANIIPIRSTGIHLAARFSSVSIRFARCPVFIDQRRAIGPVEIVGCWIPIQCDPNRSIYGWSLFSHKVEEKRELFSAVYFCQVSAKALTERLGLAPSFAYGTDQVTRIVKLCPSGGTNWKRIEDIRSSGIIGLGQSLIHLVVNTFSLRPIETYLCSLSFHKKCAPFE